MDYSYYSEVPQIHLQDDNMSASYQYHRHGMAMELDEPYMTKVDSQLREHHFGSYNQWNTQQQPLERFLSEHEKPLFTTAQWPIYNPHPAFQLNKPYEVPGPLPYSPTPRMTSPTPSHERSSICSSALSPRTESDYLSSQASQDFYYNSQQPKFCPSSPLSRSTSQTSVSNVDLLWQGQSAIQAPILKSQNFVNLNQVQGIPDPEEVLCDHEDYLSTKLKADYSVEVVTAAHPRMIELQQQRYREGTGQSLTSTSVTSSGTQHSQSIDPSEDLDAEAESASEVEDDILIKEEAGSESSSDEEYRPRSTRRKRTAATQRPTVSTPSAAKRSRTSKASKAASSKCKLCPESFTSTTALQKHIASAHTRALVCVFSFAGCTSTFASKNEWKRHVASQHLALFYWRCDVGECGKTLPTNSHARGGCGKSKSGYTHASASGGVKSNEFNRKDLFTQHMRRMHAPFSVKRQGKRNGEWEMRVKEAQERCRCERRKAPMRLGCPVMGCEGHFEGSGAWDERMEHVGRHLEKGEEVVMGGDGLLVEWARRERIVEADGRGGWRFVGMGGGVEDEEVDADGEE